MSRPLPRPVLFPYTTLFRSHREVMERLRAENPSVLAAAIPASAEVERMGVERTVLADFGRRRDRRGQDTRVDRKSTRLNSSHVSISYAVFCLKKKRCTHECV